MLVGAFVFGVEGAQIKRVLRRFVPNDYRSDFDQIWRRIRKMLYAYMRGQLIIAALIGILCGIACWVFGLADPVALGLIAGITALIPDIGPFIGAVPAILVGLAAAPFKALAIAIASFVISNTILDFLHPKSIGDPVHRPP